MPRPRHAGLTPAEQHQAAKSLRAVVDRIEAGDLDADQGVPRLLLGAALALDAEAEIGQPEATA